MQDTVTLRTARAHVLIALAVAGLVAAAPARAGDSTPGCIDGSANEARAAGDGAPLRFSNAFFRQTFTIDVSTDGFVKRDLAISIETVCGVPRAYAAQAVQLAGVDGVAVILSRTPVYEGKRLLTNEPRLTALDGADTMRLTVHLARTSHWRAGEDGRVPTFSTRRADITD
jgi:hypothetical protein